MLRGHEGAVARAFALHGRMRDGGGYALYSGQALRSCIEHAMLAAGIDLDKGRARLVRQWVSTAGSPPYSVEMVLRFFRERMGWDHDEVRDDAAISIYAVVAHRRAPAPAQAGIALATPSGPRPSWRPAGEAITATCRA